MEDSQYYSPKEIFAKQSLDRERTISLRSPRKYLKSVENVLAEVIVGWLILREVTVRRSERKRLAHCLRSQQLP